MNGTRGSAAAATSSPESITCVGLAPTRAGTPLAVEVVLANDFFDQITTFPVPVDLRAFRLVKGSPLALYIYAWLTYRMSYLHQPCLIPWHALQDQFGADYGRPRDFRRSFLAQLLRVLQVHPTARVRQAGDGLHLRLSPPHVPTGDRR